MDAKMNTTSNYVSLQAYEKSIEDMFQRCSNDSSLFCFFNSPQTKSCFCQAERKDSDENLKFHGAATAIIYFIIVTLNFGITSPI